MFDHDYRRRTSCDRILLSRGTGYRRRRFFAFLYVAASLADFCASNVDNLCVRCCAQWTGHLDYCKAVWTSSVYVNKRRSYFAGELPASDKDRLATTMFFQQRENDVDPAKAYHDAVIYNRRPFSVLRNRIMSCILIPLPLPPQWGIKRGCCVSSCSSHSLTQIDVF